MRKISIIVLISYFTLTGCAKGIQQSKPKDEDKKLWPKLLMNSQEITDLKGRLAAEPELYKWAVPSTLPQPNLNASGSIEVTPELAKLERAAFFWRLTGEERFHTAVAAFLPFIAKVRDNPVTLHTGFNAHDLNAGFTLRWLALTYDWLHESWPAEDLIPLRQTLALQASVVYQEMLGYTNYTYDQNHGYIPVVGLALAAFVLNGEDEHAATWSAYARTYMDRSTRVLGSDGFYYEGPAYYSYAFPWQTLYATVLLRMTGEDWTQRSIFQNLEKYIAHCSLPGQKFVFDFGDWGSFKGQKYYEVPWEDRYTIPSNATRMNLSPLLELEHYGAPNKDRSAVINWLLTGTTPIDPALLSKRPFPVIPNSSEIATQPTSHYFPDSEALFWRSSWTDPDATAVMFKCGPPHGHHATPLAEQYTDWRENSGHVHPDAGQFLIWSRGKFIAGDTGYTGKKYTLEHNSILIDGQGQWQDGRYHVYQNLNFKLLDHLHLENVWHNSEVMAATAVLDQGYNPDLKLQNVRRHFLMVAGKWLLIKDEIISPEPRTLSWLWHTDQKVVTAGTNRWNLLNGNASATLIALTEPAKEVIEPAIVLAYGGVPESGEPKQRGWRMQLISSKTEKPILLNAMVLNPESGNSAFAEQISATQVRLRDGSQEAVLGIQTASDGHLIWSYRINNGLLKSSL